MSLGEKIQALRKQKGMSQVQLAEALNISRQAVSKWETNESQPDIERLVEISDMFNTSTDYLIKDGHSPAVRATKSPKVVRTHRKVSKISKIGVLIPVVYSSTTVIFLLLGFGFALWHPGWLIFFAPPLVSRYLQYKLADNQEEHEAFAEAIRREEDEEE